MLVRSQDKELLVSYKTGVWQADRCKICWLSLNNGNYWLEFGEFDSNEKALKVLNKMEKEFTRVFECGENGIISNIINYPKVFYVPSNEEIDEPTVDDIIDDINKLSDTL